MKIKDLKEIIKDQVPEKNKIGYAPNKPSEKNIGYPYSKLTSNTTGEGIEEQFNFDTITARDKKIIEEVIKVLQTNDNSTVQNVTDKIKEKFKISEIPMLKYEDSLWHQLTKNENLGVSLQGYREITQEDGKKIRIPHIAMSADLDYLDDVIKRIFATVRNLNISKK
jgi:hypothetical protein